MSLRETFEHILLKRLKGAVAYGPISIPIADTSGWDGLSSLATTFLPESAPELSSAPACVLVKRTVKVELTVSTGLEGSAEPVVPLNEEEMVLGSGSGKPPQPPVRQDEHIGETSQSALHDHEGEVAHETGKTSANDADLSLITKLAIAGVILAACYGFVRAYSPRKGNMQAGRHGAYEKAGIA
jgi:hypothetical protein